MKLKLLALLSIPLWLSGCTWTANNAPQPAQSATTAFIDNVKNIDVQKTLFHMKCPNVYLNESPTPTTTGPAGIEYSARDAVQFSASAQDLKLIQAVIDVDPTGQQTVRTISCDVYLVQFATAAQTGLPALFYLPTSGVSDYNNLLHVNIVPTLDGNSQVTDATFSYDATNKKSYKATTNCNLIQPAFSGMVCQGLSSQAVDYKIDVSVAASYASQKYRFVFQYPEAVTPVLASVVTFPAGDTLSSTVSPVSPEIASASVRVVQNGNSKKYSVTLGYVNASHTISTTSELQSVSYAGTYGSANASLPASVPPNATQVYTGPQCLMYYSSINSSVLSGMSIPAGYDVPLLWQQADDLFKNSATNTIDPTKGVYDCNAITSYSANNWGMCSGVPCVPSTDTATSPAFYKHGWFALFANQKDSSGVALDVNSYTLVYLQENSDTQTITTIVLNAGDSSTCAAKKTNLSGALFYSCWGDNSSGQVLEAGNGGSLLGYSREIAAASPPGPLTQLFPFAFQNSYSKIVSGKNHSCGIVANSNRIDCWGDNDKGQLGVDPTLVAYGFFTIKKGVGGSSDFIAYDPSTASNALDSDVSIAAGDDFTCAIQASNKMTYCWGANDKGQLGRTDSGGGAYVVNAYKFSIESNGDQVDGIAGQSAQSLTAGSNHSCLLRDSTRLVGCWGDNSSSQLGDPAASGNRTQAPDGGSSVALSSSPSVSDPSFAANEISSRGDHTCGVQQSDSKVYCWGNNNKGQLGDGTTVNKDYAVAVQDVAGGPNLAAVKAVGVGKSHSCASLVSDSSVYCWGDNSNKQLGILSITALSPSLVSTPPPSESNLPMAVNILVSDPTTFVQSIAPFTAESLVGGAAHTCSVSTYNLAQNVYCWGANNKGQLGINSIIPQESPSFVNLP